MIEHELNVPSDMRAERKKNKFNCIISYFFTRR